MPQSAQESFELALRPLDKVLLSWDDPTDWADLATYGFYCVEACVVAAVLYSGARGLGSIATRYGRPAT